MIDKLELAKSRAARAQALKDDDILNEAFDLLEQEYLKFWRHETKAMDTAARESIWQAMQIIPKVKSHLQHVIDSGKIAKQRIEELSAGRPTISIP